MSPVTEPLESRLFLAANLLSDYYPLAPGSVWKYDLTKIGLAGAGFWMLIGNLVMFRMVNFKI